MRDATWFPAIWGMAPRALALAILWISPALGQVQSSPLGDGYDIDRLTPTPAGDRYMYVPEPRTRDKSCGIPVPTPEIPAITNSGSNDNTHRPLPCYVALKAFSSVQYAPKVLQLDSISGGTATKSAVVSRLHLGASWTPQPWLHWSVDVPLYYYQTDLSNTGNYYGAPSGTAQIGRQADLLDIGDIRVGGRLAWALGSMQRLGVQLFAFVPTGDHQLLTGDRSVVPPRFDALAMFSVGDHDDALRTGGARDSIGAVAAYLGVGWRSTLIGTDTPLHPGVKGGVAGSLNHICDWRYLLPVAELRFEQVQKQPGVRAFLVDASLGVRFIPIRSIVSKQPNEGDQERSGWISLMGTYGSSFLPGVPMYAVGLDLSIIPWVR
jgi:hypothetical protein